MALICDPELFKILRVVFLENKWRDPMGFGKGALLWLLGIPLPIIILSQSLCITDRLAM
jgi:hypothetical protein